MYQKYPNSPIRDSVPIHHILNIQINLNLYPNLILIYFSYRNLPIL